VLGQWIDNHWEDFRADPQLLECLENFLDSVIKKYGETSVPGKVATRLTEKIISKVCGGKWEGQGEGRRECEVEERQERGRVRSKKNI
jgi:hypothetical protein